MAINLKFDLMGNPEPPSIVLANRNGNKLGQLNVNVESIDVSDKFNDASEFSFTLNKYIDDELTPLWDKVVDFKLVYCPEWDMWFEIKVELDETTETVKTVFCTQLGQAELSQTILYNIEINTEEDISRDDYKISILYDEEDPKASILHRILEKAPHYSIAYVSSTLARIQRSFSFDGTSICDALNEIGEEIGCLFVYDSNSDKNGMPLRTISVYDLQQNCNDCNYRGEFTDVCPKCGSRNIKNGYGEDTTIFVTSDELATEGIQLVTDTDAVKNCFKLEAGDDLLTATIRNCNPNGSDYIWYFSDSLKEDMSDELVDKIESYDELYKDYYDNHESNLDRNLLNKYNALVEKYKVYYNTPSTCLNCDYKGSFESECPQCGSGNILSGKSLQSISTPIVGYSALMNAYYNTIDLALYLKSGLMPSVEMSETNAEEQAKLLTASALSPVAVANIDTVSLATANSAVLAMAKIIVKSTFKVQVNNSELSADKKTWTGNFVITNYSDEEDTAVSEIIAVRINGNTETFIQQKIEKALNKENTDDYSISGLFEKEYVAFCTELKKYALNPLISFRDAGQACIDILMEQGVGDDIADDLYKNLYSPYYNKLMAIEAEMQTREEEINLIVGVYDNEGSLTIEGLQTNIEDCKKQIQDALNFENYLGENLWLEFCSYRREDKYSNSNYISDGLNNAELFQKANEFIEVAENEIFKSSELQHSISATLNNLLAIEKFKPLVKSFKNGNWIRVRVNDEIYKLRLLQYDISYGDFDSISVEFSDVTKIKNGTTDVRDIVSQAASMASSYDAVQRQAKKGDVARSTIDQWLIDGLDTALVQIQNNDSEEIIITKNGLLGRSYSDITGTYSPEQFKLTHNILAYTSDDWKTVSAALGKHEYTKWQDNKWIKDIDYGLSSKFVTAGYILGSQIIGGEIVSSNYELGNSRKGTHINLLNGDFDFGGGKIIYNSDDNTVTLRGVTIEWSDTNAPEVEVTDISGMEEYLERLDSLEDQVDGLDGRVQTYSQTDDPSLSWTDEEKTNNIGDLWFNPDDGLTKRWNGTSWDIIEDNGLIEIIQTKAQIFTVTPTPPYYVGDLWVQGATGDILHCVASKAEGQSYSESDWVKSSKYTDDTRANAAYNLADSAKNVADNAKTIGENLVNGLGFQETEITGEYVISPVIAGGHLLIGDAKGTYAQITTDGILKANGADITGIITATKGSFDDGTFTNCTIENTCTIKGVLSGATGNFSGTIHAAAGGSIGGFTIDDSSIRHTKTSYDEADNEGMYLGIDGIGLGKGKFYVEQDGYLYSIFGNIGGWQISEDGLSKNTVLFTTSDDATMPSLVDTTADSPIRISIGTDRMARSETLEGYLDAIDTRIDYDTKQSDIGDVYIDVECRDGHTGLIATNIEVSDNGVITFELHVSDTTAQWQGADYNVSISYTCSAPTFGVLEDGSVYANAAQISGTISVSIIQGSDIYGSTIYGSTIEGGSLLIGDEDSYHAWISEDGILNAKGAIIEGAIYATDGGRIGGWNIDSNGLSADDNTVGLFTGTDWMQQSLVSSNTSPIRFFAGMPSAVRYIADNSQFMGVSIDYGATKEFVIDVEQSGGKITAVELDGFDSFDGGLTYELDIGEDGSQIILSVTNNHSQGDGDTVTGGTIYYWYSPISESNFMVLEDGSLYANAASITGAINADDGRIAGWNINKEEGILSEYFEWTSGVCTDVQICGMSATRSDSFKMPSLVNSGKYSYPRFYAGCGLHDDGETYTRIPNDTKNTDFVVLEDGSMYARAIEIIDYNEYSGDTYLDLDGLGMVVTNHLNTGNEATLEVHRGGSRRVDGVIYGQFAIDTNHYLRIAADRGGELQGTWSADAPLATDSDINLKHDIVELSDKYDAMFDTLQPVCYKYNNGTSGRTHTGFIAQDIVASMEQAQLTTNDVAAVCRLFPDSEDEERWAIRYEEFVAINTWQIQKLKRRVEELEEKLKALE